MSQRRAFPKGLNQKTVNRKKRKTSMVRHGKQVLKQLYRDMPDIDKYRQEYLDQWKHETPTESGYMRREPGLWLIRCFVYSLTVVPLRFMSLITVFGYMGAWVGMRSRIGWEFILALGLGIGAWKGCGRKSVLIALCAGYLCGDSLSLRLMKQMMYERLVKNPTSLGTHIETVSGGFAFFQSQYCFQYKDVTDTQSCLMFTYTIYAIMFYVVVWILISWCFKWIFYYIKEYFLGD